MTNNNAQVIALQSTNNLTYAGKWGDHNLTATGVWEATRNETRPMGIEGKNMAQEVLGYLECNECHKRATPDNGYQKWSMLSGVARVMYNYADRYMLTGRFRADRSEPLPPTEVGLLPLCCWCMDRIKRKVLGSSEKCSRVYEDPRKLWYNW